MDESICLLGFGKIGQAIGAYIIRSGYRVHAIDRDETYTMAFGSGGFHTSEPGVTDLLTGAFQTGQLEISADLPAGYSPGAIIVSIPFGIGAENKPDAESFIEGVLSLLPLLREKVLLVIETSVPVGFCRDQLLPALAEQGVRHGYDYLLAHSPERIKSGSMLRQLNAIPKLVAGIDGEATEKAAGLYRGFFPGGNLAVVPDIESAEMVKMAGMMYRDVNIALANQLAVFADRKGIDLVSLLPLINSDGEAKLLQPGIGVGGHCTPVYPYFMIDSFRRAGLDFKLAAEARRQNEFMPLYAAGVVSGFLPTVDGRTAARVLVLGLAFRAGVKEDARSPAWSLVAELSRQGFEVLVHDPLYTAEELASRGFKPADDLYTGSIQAVVLVTMHPEYGELDAGKLAASGVRLFVDGRNQADRQALLAAGISYRGIGN